MGIPKEFERYSYGDYLSWPEGERWELIDGVAYAMSPAPYRGHQEIVGELYRQFANYLLDKPCRVYTAPFDVKFNADEDDDAPTVLDPTWWSAAIRTSSRPGGYTEPRTSWWKCSHRPRRQPTANASLRSTNARKSRNTGS